MSQIRSDAIMSRFLGFVVTDHKGQRFTLRGSRLILASAALDVTAAGDEPVQVFAKTPMQSEPVLLATLSKAQPQEALRSRFFEEDEAVTIITNSSTPVHITGEVHLDRGLQDEIEDDEEEAARMREALGAKPHRDDEDEGEGEGDEDVDDVDEGDEDDASDEGGGAGEEGDRASATRAAVAQWYRERLPEDSDGAPPASGLGDDDDEEDEEEEEEEEGEQEGSRTEMAGAVAAAWMHAFAQLLAGDEEDVVEFVAAPAPAPASGSSKKRRREPTLAAVEEAEAGKKAEKAEDEEEALVAQRRAASKAEAQAAAPRLKETKRERRERERREAVQEAARLAVAERARMEAEEVTEAAKRSKRGGAEAAKPAKAAMAAKAARGAPKELVLPGGVRAIDEFLGMGQLPKAGRRVTVKYVGKLANGEKFDSNNSFTFRLGVGEVVPGFDVAVKSMRVGGRRRVVIPPAAGYGSKRVGPIPPNSQLVFDLQLIRAM